MDRPVFACCEKKIDPEIWESKYFRIYNGINVGLTQPTSNWFYCETCQKTTDDRWFEVTDSGTLIYVNKCICCICKFYEDEQGYEECPSTSDTYNSIRYHRERIYISKNKSAFKN